MIRQAAESELPAIMSMIGLVVRQMRDEGSDQRSEQYPAAADFLSDIRQGSLFVETAEGEPGELRALACLNREEPEENAPVRWSRPGPATVIHRLAVHPGHRKQGIAKALFLFAEDLARGSGTDYIRSDTYSLNAPMNALFVKLGYRQTGGIRFPGRREEFFCYDKRLG